MHPRLQEIATYNAGVRAELTAIVNSTPAEHFDRREKPDGWNGHQIIHHLGHVEGSATKFLEGAVSKALAEGTLGMDPETSSVLPWLARFNVMDRKATPISAPERLHPPADANIAVAWPQLQAVRERSLRLMEMADGRDLTKIAFPHPLFGPLNGYEWLNLLGGHEARHLEQLKAALANG